MIIKEGLNFKVNSKTSQCDNWVSQQNTSWALKMFLKCEARRKWHKGELRSNMIWKAVQTIWERKKRRWNTSDKFHTLSQAQNKKECLCANLSACIRACNSTGIVERERERERKFLLSGKIVVKIYGKKSTW